MLLSLMSRVLIPEDDFPEKGDSLSRFLPERDQETWQVLVKGEHANHAGDPGFLRVIAAIKGCYTGLPGWFRGGESLNYIFESPVELSFGTFLFGYDNKTDLLFILNPDTLVLEYVTTWDHIEEELSEWCSFDEVFPPPRQLTVEELRGFEKVSHTY